MKKYEDTMTVIVQKAQSDRLDSLLFGKNRV